jgi:hypothetical protein
MVLSPKRAQAYSQLAALYGFTRDLEALRRLLPRVEAADLDLSDGTQRALDYYQKKDDAKRRDEMHASVHRQEAILSAARSKGGVTFAVAASKLAALKAGGPELGLEADAGEMVRLAEEAHAAAPSQATRQALVAVLLFRADRTLARQEPAYAAMAGRSQRALSAGYLIADVLGQTGPVRERARKDPDVQRVVELVREEGQICPQDVGPWGWALLRGGNPGEADRAGQVVLADTVSQVQRALRQRLEPLSAAAAFQAYWAAQIAGKEAEGREALRNCAAHGVPLPFDVR